MPPKPFKYAHYLEEAERAELDDALRKQAGGREMAREASEVIRTLKGRARKRAKDEGNQEG